MMNPASLPHVKLMRATKLIGTPVAPYQDSLKLLVPVCRVLKISFHHDDNHQKKYHTHFSYLSRLVENSVFIQISDKIKCPQYGANYAAKHLLQNKRKKRTKN